MGHAACGMGYEAAWGMRRHGAWLAYQVETIVQRTILNVTIGSR